MGGKEGEWAMGERIMEVDGWGDPGGEEIEEILEDIEEEIEEDTYAEEGAPPPPETRGVDKEENWGEGEKGAETPPVGLGDKGVLLPLPLFAIGRGGVTVDCCCG